MISLSDKAAAHVRRHMADRPGSVGLRVGLRKSGCNGYSYAVDYADAVGPLDHSFEDHGIKVVVSDGDAALLHGVVIDVVRDGLNEKLVFSNPNAGDSCGCGESFSARVAGQAGDAGERRS
jgi:iron-sulfur cluster assembly protein